MFHPVVSSGVRVEFVKWEATSRRPRNLRETLTAEFRDPYA